MKNSADQGGCYPQRPKAKVDNTRGFIKFLCRRSVGFFSRAFLVFLMKESTGKKRRRKQRGKLMAKSRSLPRSAEFFIISYESQIQ